MTSRKRHPRPHRGHRYNPPDQDGRMQLQDITTCPVLRRTLDLSACHSHTASPHHGRRTGRTNIIDRVHQRNPAWSLLLLLSAANCCCAAMLGTTAQNPGNRASDIPYAPLLPSPKTLVLTPLNPTPPPLFCPSLNLHRHRRCRRPPASIFPICRAPSHKVMDFG